MLHGLASAHAERIEQARGERAFCSLDDFARRSGLGRSVLSRLAKAGTFGSLGLTRRGALWHALGQDQKELPLFDAAKGKRGRHLLCEAHEGPFRQKVPATFSCVPLLPKMSAAEEVLADYRSTGLSLSAHPLEFLRPDLEGMNVVPAEKLKSWPDGKPVSVAGIVLVRQRPGTAKGITFMTLEDESGQANLIIRPGVWKRWRSAALGATLLLAHGRLQRQGQIIHVLATKLEDLSDRLNALGSQSRDFC